MIINIKYFLDFVQPELDNKSLIFIVGSLFESYSNGFSEKNCKIIEDYLKSKGLNSDELIKEYYMESYNKL